MNTSKTFELPIKLEGILFTLVDKQIKFLLLKRSPEDGGFWQPLTGTLDSDESLISCLKREVSEEIGVKESQIQEITDMFYSFTWEKKGKLIYEYVYGVRLNPEQVITLSTEHTEYKWCDFDQAIELLTKDNNKNAFKEFINFYQHKQLK
jgi:dihydroneopterin triphosphate diphosphatase